MNEMDTFKYVFWGKTSGKVEPPKPLPDPPPSAGKIETVEDSDEQIEMMAMLCDAWRKVKRRGIRNPKHIRAAIVMLAEEITHPAVMVKQPRPEPRPRPDDLS